MKFKISRSSFFKTLSHLQGIVDKKNSLPILANILIEAKDNQLTLSSTDMDISIIEKINCNVMEDGATTINSQILYDIVRKIDENEMHDFTALFGSGPAYLIYFYEALLDCGKFKNISNEDKSMLIIHLLNSTSKMLFVTKDVKKLRHSISSKGGTTEAAIQLLEDKNFKEIIAEALEVAMKRSIDISK